jgi:hypothetical protein
MGIFDLFKERHLRRPSAAPSAPTLEPIEVLARRLLGADETAAIQASEALAERGEAGVNALGGALAQIENKVVAEATARALIARGPVRAIPFLVLGLEDGIQVGKYGVAECYEKALSALGPLKTPEGAIDWEAVRKVVGTISNSIVTSPDNFPQGRFSFKSLTVEFCSALDKNCVVWRYSMSNGKDLDCKRALALLDHDLMGIGLKAKVDKIRRDDLDGELVQCIFKVLEVNAWRAQVEAKAIDARRKREEERKQCEAQEQSRTEHKAEEEAKVRNWIDVKDYRALKANWEIARPIMLRDLRSRTSFRAISAAEFLIRRGDQRDVPELARVVEVPFTSRFPNISGIRNSWDIQMQNMDTQIHQVDGTTRIAEMLLNCGHQGLGEAAKTWASAHGYTIRRESGPGQVRWGSV